MAPRFWAALRRALIPVVTLLAVPLACTSGSGDGGAASCGGVPASEGAGWNLGRGPLDPKAAARAAVYMASCVPDDRPTSTLAGFYDTRREGSAFDLDVIACLSTKATGCQAVAECTGITMHYQKGCSSQPSCEGNTVVGCHDSLSYRVDCNKRGMVAQCVAGAGCVPCEGGAMAPTCDSQTFSMHCEDGRPLDCDDGHVVKGLRCADVGLECGTNSYGDYVSCFGAGAACQTSSSGPGMLVGTGCAGASLTACVGGKSHSIACSEIAAGFTCQTVPGSYETAYLCGLAAECNPEDEAWSNPKCDGNSVVVCNAGRIEKVDCLALGFTGCAQQYGRCVPGPYSEI